MHYGMVSTKRVWAILSTAESLLQLILMEKAKPDGPSVVTTGAPNQYLTRGYFVLESPKLAGDTHGYVTLG